MSSDTVQRAIAEAEAFLPGTAARDGEEDPRWQAIIEIAHFIDTEPEAVWAFIERWGDSADEDLRTAIATCLLEHLLEEHFDAYFDRVARRARSNRRFADTVSSCWVFYGKRHERAIRFERLSHALRRPRWTREDV